MKYNHAKHHRRSIRLHGFDYSSPGYYFITICTQDRTCLFGEIIKGKMILNDAAKMIEYQWTLLPKRFADIRLDENAIMPNHFHAILEIMGQSDSNRAPTNSNRAPTNSNRAPTNSNRAPTRGAPTGMEKPSLGDMVGAFQSIVTVEYIRGVKTKKWRSFDKKLWQRNYWEHIIRNDQELSTIRNYIRNNPLNWGIDKLNGQFGNCVKEETDLYGEESWIV